MKQINYASIFVQAFWLIVSFSVFYFLYLKFILVQVFTTLKTREKMLAFALKVNTKWVKSKMSTKYMSYFYFCGRFDNLIKKLKELSKETIFNLDPIKTVRTAKIFLHVSTSMRIAADKYPGLLSVDFEHWGRVDIESCGAPDIIRKGVAMGQLLTRKEDSRNPRIYEPFSWENDIPTRVDTFRLDGNLHGCDLGPQIVTHDYKIRAIEIPNAGTRYLNERVMPEYGLRVLRTREENGLPKFVLDPQAQNPLAAPAEPGYWVQSEILKQTQVVISYQGPWGPEEFMQHSLTHKDKERNNESNNGGNNSEGED